MQGVAFTDLKSLSAIRGDDPKSMQQAAQQFEALFVDMMLKSAREATNVLAKDNPLESFETGMHREMLDHQLAVTLAERGGIGLAPLLLRQWQRGSSSAIQTDTAAPLGSNPAAQRSAPTTRAAEVDRSRLQALRAEGQRVAPPADVMPADASVVDPDSASDAIGVAMISGNDTVTDPPNEQVSAAERAEATVGDRRSRLDALLQSLAARVRREEAATVAARVTATRASKAPLFDSPASFVQTVLPAIRAATAGTGVDEKALLAHAALETGWGQSVITDGAGGSSHNLFGIKASRWSGPAAVAETIEIKGGRAQREQQTFRVYGDVEASIRDLLSHLRESNQYRRVVSSLDDARAYAKALGDSGYATDPHYGRKLLAVLNSTTMREALGGDR